MQKIATRVFVVSSIAFGLVGAVFFLGLAAGWEDSVAQTVFAIWGVSGCVVLSSFALSVAAKYLGDES
jgi:uncharacterized membrane protein YuzA (DUF378 family)